jgi:fatty-acid peroxygenase
MFAGRGLDSARQLEPSTAGVELLNVLRPTVAVNRFVAFAALALHQNEWWRVRLRGARATEPELEAFVHEVRRLAPFFPAVAARVRRDFEWHGVCFRQGQSVLLDLFGSNRDPRTWPQPTAFRPDRFLDGTGDAFQLIPQGGGDHARGHRCAGEWATIELCKVAVRTLASDLTYDVPEQDLSVPLTRMPSAPRSGFVLSRVRVTSQSSA